MIAYKEYYGPVTHTDPHALSYRPDYGLSTWIFHAEWSGDGQVFVFVKLLGPQPCRRAFHASLRAEAWERFLRAEQRRSLVA